MIGHGAPEIHQDSKYVPSPPQLEVFVRFQRSLKQREDAKDNV